MVLALKHKDLPHYCENCFKGIHHGCTGENLLGKPCLCICIGD